MDERTVVNEGVALRTWVQGEGPTVLLLHGWPDTHALWDDVAPALVAAGFRVATADLRGCGRSDKPSDTEAYAMRHLVTDVAAIIDDLGPDSVTVVGHDWGANLAWAVATFLPDKVSALVALSVGHPSAFRSAGLDQQMKSWYTLLFFHEGVGEAFLRQHDYEVMRTWLRHPRVEEVIAELERDGQLAAHLRWYRANLAPDAFVTPPPVLPPVSAPTLGIWSRGDLALTRQQMANSAQYCAGGFTFVEFETGGHWLPLEMPEQISREIVNFAQQQGILGPAPC
jgi:pimeloyl-ACP methyl ester carboxylesterase